MTATVTAVTRPGTDHDAIVRRACAGDDAALDELVALYHDRVYRYGRAVCRDTDIDDAVQEAFLALTRSRASFRGEAGIGTWLFTAVRNACRQLLRPVARRTRVLGVQAAADALDDVAAADLGPEDLAVRDDLVRLVHQALARLDPGHREILVLRDLEGRSGPETAVALGLSNDAMKSRLHRARLALRHEVARHQF